MVSPFPVDVTIYRRIIVSKGKTCNTGHFFALRPPYGLTAPAYSGSSDTIATLELAPILRKGARAPLRRRSA